MDRPGTVQPDANYHRYSDGDVLILAYSPEILPVVTEQAETKKCIPMGENKQVRVYHPVPLATKLTSGIYPW